MDDPRHPGIGSRGLHFNDLRRGIPKIFPTLLSARLQRLSRAGIVARREDGNRVLYELTPAGLELRPIVDALGTWGIRWIPELGDADLDPKLLLWDMHRNVDLDRVPAGRTVVQFTFSGVPPMNRDWWLVIELMQVDVCDVDPGHPVQVAMTASSRSGEVTASGRRQSGRVRCRSRGRRPCDVRCLAGSGPSRWPPFPAPRLTGVQ